MPRTQLSCRAQDGCVARMMRKPRRATLTADAALLLSWGMGLLVRHVSDHADEVDGTIAFASRGVHAQAIASATKEVGYGLRSPDSRQGLVTPLIH